MIQFLYRYFYMRANFSVDCFITGVGGKVESWPFCMVKGGNRVGTGIEWGTTLPYGGG
jgi:hypothetical protein